MKITKEQLKSWRACSDGYRWFLNKFPDGGDYADVHQGLINDNRVEDAGWLTEKMYQSLFGTPELPQAEASAGNKMIETMNNMDMPTIESISEWGGQQAASGDRTRQAASGYCTQQVSSGDENKQAASGDWTRQVSSGDCTQQASSGYETKQAASGDCPRQVSSGDESRQVSSGGWTRQVSSGDRARHSATGHYPKIATTGMDVEIMATGNHAVVVAADGLRKIVFGEGGCASVAYHDGDRIRFAVAYVGENGIEAGVAYTVIEKGEFVKLEGSDHENYTRSWQSYRHA